MYPSYLKTLKARSRPFHERELIYTVSEIAKTLGLSLITIHRYRHIFPDFPHPITSHERGVPYRQICEEKWYR